MRIPRYWARESYSGVDRNGNPQNYQAWGWSFESHSEAQKDAVARAQRVFERFIAGSKPDIYDYLERPLKEEIIKTIGPDDNQIALITRNRYGALILNSASVCFVDVDFPDLKAKGFKDGLGLIFSGKKRKFRMEEVRIETIERIKTWALNNPSHSFRFYRTHAGLRLLFTDKLYNPLAEDTYALLTELGSDYLYKRLTVKQECFRARLTPKPWRIGLRRPPNQYPWDGTDAELRYRHWLKEYEIHYKEYTTCKLIESFGSIAAEPQISTIVDLHDQYACNTRELDLA